MNVKWGLILQMVVLPLAGHAWAGDLNHTNASLPERKPIWPLPVIETPIVIKAAFRSSSDVNKIRQGDWITTTHLITYDIHDVIRGVFESKQLIFICDERWPTPGSGIMLKALPFPFRVGSSGRFYLEANGDRYTIRSYRLTIKPKH
jgi:hypothetical protein